MPSPTNEIHCRILLEAAASAQFGIVLRTSNPFKARAALYDARKGDPSLAALHIRVSPVDSENELWIIKREAMPGFNMEAIL